MNFVINYDVNFVNVNRIGHYIFKNITFGGDEVTVTLWRGMGHANRGRVKMVVVQGLSWACLVGLGVLSYLSGLELGLELCPWALTGLLVF